MGTGEDRLAAAPDSRAGWEGEAPGSKTVLREEVFPKDQGEAMGFRVMPDRHRPAGVAFRDKQRLGFYLSSWGFR